MGVLGTLWKEGRQLGSQSMRAKACKARSLARRAPALLCRFSLPAPETLRVAYSDVGFTMSRWYVQHGKALTQDGARLHKLLGPDFSGIEARAC